VIDWEWDGNGIGMWGDDRRRVVVEDVHYHGILSNLHHRREKYAPPNPNPSIKEALK
jgi:hypothetical protein